MALKNSSSFLTKTKLIGVIHLPGLPGSPAAIRSGDEAWETIDDVGHLAIKEAQMLIKAGFQAIIIENYGDAPFYKNHVPTETLIALTLICAAVKASINVPVGLNVLRNDAHAALHIASCTGLDFIRVNILNGVSATDQGLIEGNAASLIRQKEFFKSKVSILADVQVKHATSLLKGTLSEHLKDTYLRSGANGLILTGTSTGNEVSQSDLKEALEFNKKFKIPLFIGSGVNDKNSGLYKKNGCGVIVSSSLRKNSTAGEPLDSKNIQKFILNYKKNKK